MVRHYVGHRQEVQGGLAGGVQATDLGGLGVLDLRFFSFALRLQWEWLSRTARDSCWSSLPSRSEKSVVAMAAISMTVNIGDGASAKLWTDSWASVDPLCLYTLYAAISRAGKKRSIKDGIFQHRWARDIVGAPTTQVLCQYLRVWAILRDVVLDPLAAARGPVCLEMDSGSQVFGFLGLSDLLRWLNDIVGSKGTLEDQGAGASQVFLLASASPLALDRRAPQEAWSPGRGCLCSLRPSARDRRSPTHRLRDH